MTGWPHDAPLPGWDTGPMPGERPLFGDPEPVPNHDPTTGELTKPEVIVGQVVTVEVPEVMAGAAGEALEDWRGAAIAQHAAALGDQLVARLQAQAGVLRDRRPGGRLTDQAVQPELVWLASAADTLGAIGGAFTRAQREARDLAGEVVLDVRPAKAEPGAVGSASVLVGAGTTDGGGQVRVTRTQGSEVVTDADAVVDLLPSWLLAQAGDGVDAVMYARGARDALALLLQVTSPPKFKSTALDKLRDTMTNADQPDLAKRLAAAYGRVAKGEPRTTIEHVPDET